MEDYLGKDYAGRPDLSKDPYNDMFSFHGTLRELFPDEKDYLKMPAVREQSQRLKEFIGLFREDGKPLDPRFANYLVTADLSALHERLLADIRHPTDPNRTFQGDLAERVSDMLKRQAGDGTRAERLEHREVRKILEDLDAEYSAGNPTLPPDAEDADD